jgi:hypothetical protein
MIAIWIVTARRSSSIATGNISLSIVLVSVERPPFVEAVPVPVVLRISAKEGLI